MAAIAESLFASTTPTSLHKSLFLDAQVLHESIDDEAFFTPRGDANYMSIFTPCSDGTCMSLLETPPPALPFVRFSSALSYSADESCSETDLDHFHGEARLDVLLSKGEFSKVRVLQECCSGDGSVELHRRNDQENSEDDLVVIKRLPLSRLHANEGKEKDECKVHRLGHERHMEDVLTEVGVYSFLSRQPSVCSYILKMHRAFEVDGDVWLALQYANGGDFFDIITAEPATSKQVVRWMWQLLQAVDFLHQHRIGHRDISVENMLLHDKDLRLMDFGQAVQTHATNGVPLRYFREMGKDYCRSPERYVPREPTMRVTAPRFSRPGEIAFIQFEDYLCEVRLPHSSTPLEECSAEPCGYLVPPADMFSCGVCLFVMAVRMPPWRSARPSDTHFAFVQSKGIEGLLKSWRQDVQPEMQELMAMLLRADPHERLDVGESLTHPLFDGMANL